MWLICMHVYTGTFMVLHVIYVCSSVLVLLFDSFDKMES